MGASGALVKDSFTINVKTRQDSLRCASRAQGILIMAVDGSTPIPPGRAATQVTGAIRDAAQATGTSFNYLLATAKIESNFDPGMTMQSSSATGLFEFIDQTWLGTLKQAGATYGYGSYANAIQQDASGRWVVPDPK